MILGLDISTSITGATILDDCGRIVYCEDWDTRKIKNVFHKASTIQSFLREILNKYDIQYIFIEQSLQMFRSGFSSAKTLTTLSKFNGIVSWMCWEIFRIEPTYFAAISARKACGITVPRGSKAKEVVLEHIKKEEPDFKYELTRAGNPSPGTYDRADSIVIAKAGFLSIKN